MITSHEVARLAASGESEVLEFKSTTGQRNEAARTLSAMLNRRGGTVLFGIQPTGNVVGQQVGAKTLEDVTSACQDIHPAHPPSIERVAVPGGANREVLVVKVPAGGSKPYSWRGRYYVRSGAATVAMPDETQLSLVLERAHSLDRWEIAGSQRDLGAIDGGEVSAFRDDAIAARRAGFHPHATTEDVLRSLSLLDSGGEPTRGAIALFGRAEAFAGQYPTLGCRLVAVSGTTLGEEFRDDELWEGNAFAALRRAVFFCDKHLHHPVRINGLYASRNTEIPLEVVREALANAFGHRDYSVAGLVQVRIFDDRLEVWSPGGLHFGLTPADLYVPHGSHPWNPNMMGCLYRRGIVEQLGSGTLRMAQMCAEAGLGRPVFISGGASVVCSVPRRGYWLTPDGASTAFSGLDAELLIVLAGGPVSRGQLVTRTGSSSAEVRDALARLRAAGLAGVEGHGRGARWSLSSG